MNDSEKANTKRNENESFNQMVARMDGGKSKAVGFIGDGTKSHLVEVTFITLNGEKVIYGFSPLCRTSARFNRNLAEIGTHEVTCTKCCKKN